MKDKRTKTKTELTDIVPQYKQNKFDLEQAITVWASKVSQNSGTALSRVDLQFNEDVLKKIKDRYHGNQLESLSTATKVINRGERNLLEKKGFSHDEYKIGGHASTHFRKEIKKNVTTKHELTFTKSWGGGLSLGVSYYVDLGADVHFERSKTETKGTEIAEEVSREIALDTEPGCRYKITEDVYEYQYEEVVDLEIILKGHVAVCLKDKKALSKGGESHKLHFLPITTIMASLQQAGELPSELQCQVNQDEVIIRLKGEYRYNTYRADWHNEIISKNQTSSLTVSTSTQPSTTMAPITSPNTLPLTASVSPIAQPAGQNLAPTPVNTIIVEKGGRATLKRLDTPIAISAPSGSTLPKGLGEFLDGRVSSSPSPSFFAQRPRNFEVKEGGKYDETEMAVRDVYVEVTTEETEKKTSPRGPGSGQ